MQKTTPTFGNNICFSKSVFYTSLCDWKCLKYAILYQTCKGSVVLRRRVKAISERCFEFKFTQILLTVTRIMRLKSANVNESISAFCLWNIFFKYLPEENSSKPGHRHSSLKFHSFYHLFLIQIFIELIRLSCKVCPWVIFNHRSGSDQLPNSRNLFFMILILITPVMFFFSFTCLKSYKLHSVKLKCLKIWRKVSSIFERAIKIDAIRYSPLADGEFFDRHKWDLWTE